MLVAVVGDRGSGKTLLLTVIATKSKREIYSNFKVKVENYKPLEVLDLLTLSDGIDVFIDEGYTWLESRTSSSTLNRYLSYIVLQSRKRTIDIYLTAQMFSSIDVRFREQSDIIVKCSRIYDKERKKDLWDFSFEFLEVSTGNVKKFYLDYKKASNYFDLFDTYQIVEPHTKEMLEFKLLESDPKKMFEKISSIANKIKKSLSVITHDSVKAGLMKAGYDIGYERYVYVFLKNLV